MIGYALKGSPPPDLAPAPGASSEVLPLNHTYKIINIWVVGTLSCRNIGRTPYHIDLVVNFIVKHHQLSLRYERYSFTGIYMHSDTHTMCFSSLHVFLDMN